jgi:ferredoxin
MENWGVGKIEDFTWKSLHRQLLVHRVRPLHHLLPRLRDREAAVADAPHPRPQGRDEGPRQAPGQAQEGRRLAQGGRRARPGADKDLIAKIKAELAGLPPLVGGRVKDETLWACTTCGACQEVCPVFIDHPLKILQMRQHIVLNDESGRTPAEVTRLIGNISVAGNPWSLNQDDRMKWAEGLDVKTVEEQPDAEYLLFVGCAGAFDDNAKKTTRALVKVLHAANVSFAVLGKREKCSGDPVRRLGAEMDYQLMAQENVNMFNEAKVTKVIASCPHCFHTIKNEYPQFGGNYEVIHHSQLIATCLESGKLKVDRAARQAVHLPRQLLHRPLERRLRRAAADPRASHRGQGIRPRARPQQASTASAAAPAAAACGWRRSRASASTSTAPKRSPRAAPTRSPSHARSAPQWLRTASRPSVKTRRSPYSISRR